MVSQCALYHSKRSLISIWSCVEVTATKPTWCNSEYQNARTIAPPCILRLLVTFLVGLGWCPSPSPFSPPLPSPLLSSPLSCPFSDPISVLLPPKGLGGRENSVLRVSIISGHSLQRTEAQMSEGARQWSQYSGDVRKE